MDPRVICMPGPIPKFELKRISGSSPLGSPHLKDTPMTSIKSQDPAVSYDVEPATTEKTWSEADEELTEHMVIENLEEVERRVYYVRGFKDGERVVASIRSRSRKRAIEIATRQGIEVDRRDLKND